MNAITVYALHCSDMVSSVSGLSAVRISSDRKSIEYVLKDGNVLSAPIQDPLKPEVIDICNKLSTDSSNNLLYDGKLINDLDLTDEQKAALDDIKKETVNNPDGSIDETFVLGDIQIISNTDVAGNKTVKAYLDTEKIITTDDETSDTDITFPSDWI